MSLTNRARVGDALDLLFNRLLPYVERQMKAVYREGWLDEARGALHNKAPERWDVSDLLTLIYFKYAFAFSDLGHDGRSRVSLLKEVRKKWAHQVDLSLDDTRRALETTVLLLRALGADAEADRLEPQVLELMHRELQQKLDTPLPELSGEATTAPEPVPEEMAGGEDGGLRRHIQKVRSLWQKTASEPLELRRDLLDAVERAAEPHRRHFPFNRVVVHILAGDDRTRHLYEAALTEPGEPFREAVCRRLADARVPVEGHLHVGWKLHRTPPEKLAEAFREAPVYVALHRRKLATTATLTVVRGKAKRGRYTIRSERTTTIGRLRDVIDDKGRLVRRNTVAFQDYEDGRLKDEEHAILKTVSRVHARIRYDEADGVFRLYDDQSTCGTSVVREDYRVPIQVKQHPVALQNGDLLYFGKACLRFSIGRKR